MAAKRDNPGKHKATQGKTAAGRDARKVFVEAFSADKGKGRITRAAQAAYPNQKKQSASVTGTRLLKDPKIQASIQKRLETACSHANITRQEILGMVAEVARHSISDIPLPTFKEDGTLDWSAAEKAGVAHLIKEVEITERHSKAGTRRTARFKAMPRDWALSELKEIFGMHKQAAPNPIDSAKEMLAILRNDARYADLDDMTLRELVGARLNVAPSDLGDDLSQ